MVWHGHEWASGAHSRHRFTGCPTGSPPTDPACGDLRPPAPARSGCSPSGVVGLPLPLTEHDRAAATGELSMRQSGRAPWCSTHPGGRAVLGPWSEPRLGRPGCRADLPRPARGRPAAVVDRSSPTHRGHHAFTGLVRLDGGRCASTCQRPGSRVAPLPISTTAARAGVPTLSYCGRQAGPAATCGRVG